MLFFQDILVFCILEQTRRYVQLERDAEGEREERKEEESKGGREKKFQGGNHGTQLHKI